MSSSIPKKIGENQYQIDADSNFGMKVPVRIYADDALLQKMLSDRTIMQARNVASIPGIVSHSVVLPDGHEGYGFPVGGVAAMDAEEGMISPGGVGYDINCGVRLLRSNLTEQTVRLKLKELVNDLFSSIPSGVGSKGAVRLYGTQTLIRDGSLKAFSVGFYPLKGKKDTATDTLYITEVELLENSIVSIPMNQDSIFSVIKSMDEEGRTKFLSEVEEYDSTQIKMKEGDLGLEKKEITINVTVMGVTDNSMECEMPEDYPEDETEDTTMMAARSAIIDAISEKVNTAVHDFSSRDFVLDKGKKTVIDSRFYRVLGHDLLNHEISAQEVTILGNPINNILKIDDRSIVMLSLSQDKVEFKTVEERDNSEIEKIFINYN